MSLIFIHLGSQVQKQHKKRKGKFFYCPTIFCSHKYHKIVKNFMFEQVKEHFFWPKHQTFVIKQIKIIGMRSGIQDPEKNLFRIPGQKGTGSRICNPKKYNHTNLDLFLQNCVSGMHRNRCEHSESSGFQEEQKIDPSLIKIFLQKYNGVSIFL